MAMHLKQCPFNVRDQITHPMEIPSGMIVQRGPEFVEIMQRMYPDFKLNNQFESSACGDEEIDCEDSNCWWYSEDSN